MKIKKIFLQEIIDFLGNKIINIEGEFSKKIYIDNLADLEHVNCTTLDWVSSNNEFKQQIVETSLAQVMLVDKDIVYSEKLKNKEKILIKVHNPRVALAEIGNNFFVDEIFPIIHPTAIIDKNAIIGKNVTIGAYSIIGNVRIGDNTYIDSNVRLHDNVIIGNHCKIKSNTVIGGEGFGFEKDETGNKFRFPQIGGVKIGNYVEIGANTCIDRGSLSDTIIDDYVKISNLCQIAHNVRVGENTIITGCKIAGSCCIGYNVWIGPNTTIKQWCHIGNNVFIGMGSLIISDIPDNETVWMKHSAKHYQINGK